MGVEQGSGGAQPAGGVRARRRSVVRHRLTAAALELFTERGYDATTVDDIVAAGRTSRSTFFRYFGTKDDVVLSLLDDVGGDWRRCYEEALAHDEPGPALARAMRASVGEAAEDPRDCSSCCTSP